MLGYVCCPVTMCFRVKEALAAEQKVNGQGQRNSLSSFLPLINTCVIPALFRCVYVCVCVCKYVCTVLVLFVRSLSHLTLLGDLLGHLQSYDIIILRVMTCKPLLSSFFTKFERNAKAIM